MAALDFRQLAHVNRLLFFPIHHGERRSGTGHKAWSRQRAFANSTRRCSIIRKLTFPRSNGAMSGDVQYENCAPKTKKKNYMTTTDFAGLGLPDTLVRSLEQAGFTTPTPIQAKAIPAQLEGRDILGIAQTGSGKTAAFGLPILAGLNKREGKREPRTAGALILAPTRELAVQIEEMIRTYAARGHITTALVLGGVSRNAQIQKLARGVDILVATPGRLCDLMEAKKVRLDQTSWLVLDEADRMLDMGFINPVKQIAAAMSPRRQTALFSATMAPEVAKLAATLLNNPVRVEASPQGSTVAKIEQSVILTPSKLKRDELNKLLKDDSLTKVIVFSRTKHRADRVAKNLSIDGHSAAAIHGNKTQNARQNALRGFKSGKVRILVATDIAARGIDVPNISHVINYELPDDAENYVHRIGRTGRNGASGIAITLVDGTERGKLRDVERIIRRTLPYTGELPAGEPGPSAHPSRRGGGGRPKQHNGNASYRKRNSNGNSDAKPYRNSNSDGDAKPYRNSEAKPHRKSNRPPAAGSKQWQVMLDVQAVEPQVEAKPQAEAKPQSRPQSNGRPQHQSNDGAPKGQKSAKGKRPRWNKRRKDAAKASKARDPRFATGANAA